MCIVSTGLHVGKTLQFIVSLGPELCKPALPFSILSAVVSLFIIVTLLPSNGCSFNIVYFLNYRNYVGS